VNKTSNNASWLGRTTHSPEFLSALITLLLLALQLCFIRPYFLVNDDIFKVLMVKGIGVSLSPTPYFLYSNVLLGMLFLKMNAWFPNLPFYALFLFGVQCLSLWVFLWVLWLKFSGWFHQVLFVVSVFAAQFIFFYYLHFTMTSMMAASAGVFAFCVSIEPQLEKRRWCLFLAAGVLWILSWLIRENAFWAILLVSAPLMGFQALQAGFKTFFKRQWKFVVVVGGVIFLTGAFDRAWFEKNIDWKNFQDFNAQASRFQQFHPRIYSNETQPAFDSVGWSQNDFWLFTHWYWLDMQKLNTNTLARLEKEIPSEKGVSWEGSFGSLLDLLNYFWNDRIVLYFFIFCTFCRKKELLFLLAQFGWILIVFEVLIRYLKATDQVTSPILVFLMCSAIFLAQTPTLPVRPEQRISHLWFWSRALLLIFGLIMTGPCLQLYHSKNVETQKAEAQMRICLQQLHPTENQLYITWSFPYELFRAFDNYECFRSFNMVSSSFIQRSPASLAILDRFGVKNIFRDAVNNPKIFMICDAEQGVHYHEYLKENFHEDIRAKKVYDFPYFKVFSIVSKRTVKAD
jgi:hypothetical protein